MGKATAKHNIRSLFFAYLQKIYYNNEREKVPCLRFRKGMNNLKKETILFCLSQSAELLKISLEVLQVSPKEGLHKDLYRWFKENQFDIELSADFAARLSEEAYQRYAAELKKDLPKETNIALKYFALAKLRAAVSGISALIYKSPNSVFVSKLLETKLVRDDIVNYRWAKNGERIISLINHRAYTTAITELENDYKARILALKKPKKDALKEMNLFVR